MTLSSARVLPANPLINISQRVFDLTGCIVLDLTRSRRTEIPFRDSNIVVEK